MTGPTAVTIRRLLPVFAVCGVLALSLIAPSQAFGSLTALGYGYGYGNNCGVKGYGFHDHGKACPNRPFPGKGKGLTKGTEEPGTDSTPASEEKGSNPDTDEVIIRTPEVGLSSTSSSGDQGAAPAKGHGKRHGHRKGE